MSISNDTARRSTDRSDEDTKKIRKEGETPRADDGREEQLAKDQPQEVQLYDSFDDMGLPDLLLRGIYGYGFEAPSAIQQKAVVPLSEGRDLIGQAEAGSGKTAAFLIGMLARIETHRRFPQALILAPVRELATQIHGVCQALSQYLPDVQNLCLIGGSSVRQDIKDLSRGAHVVIGTPGRLKHMINADYLNCRGLKTIILDEADELLSQGFKDDIYDIFQVCPQDVQACLFSATMPPEIVALSSRFLRDPVSIRVEKENLNRLDCVQQFYVDCGDARWKLDTLLDIYSALDINQSMIFTNTKQGCARLYADLEERDFTCQVIHGGMTQQERNLAMQAFKTGSARILLSTGLLKRGIDVQAVNLVVNYDLPTNREVYIHAVNRVGRYGRKGVAINFLGGGRDMEMLRELERYYNTEVREMPDPAEVARYM